MSKKQKSQVLTEYHIRFEFYEILELCLDDFVERIAGCKPSYLTKIKNKTKRNGLWYKDAEKTISELCPKLRSKKAKEFYQRWKSSVNTFAESTNVILSGPSEEQLNINCEDKDTLVSFLDIQNNYFQYKGTKVFVIVKEAVPPPP